MFAKFNLELNKDDIMLDDKYQITGHEQYENNKKLVHDVLDKYLTADGVLDASLIEEDWFPSVNAQVFLSHSHQDEKIVIRLAGYLFENYGIRSFIDSAVWGYANNLLKQIDNRYCVQSKKPTGGCTYDYDKRNQSTAHVHIILQGALAKMINHCEALVFVNTPHSLNMSDIGNDTTTASPWIYSELLMANTFPARRPEQYGILNTRSNEILEYSELKVGYRVGLTSFVDLDLNDIKSASIKIKLKDARKILNQLYLDKKLLVRPTVTG